MSWFIFKSNSNHFSSINYLYGAPPPPPIFLSPRIPHISFPLEKNIENEEREKESIMQFRSRHCSSLIEGPGHRAGEDRRTWGREGEYLIGAYRNRTSNTTFMDVPPDHIMFPNFTHYMFRSDSMLEEERKVWATKNLYSIVAY